MNIIYYIEKLYFWFMLYSVIGWLYEVFLFFLWKKKFINRGFLNGPYCPIYGSGSLLLLFVLGKIENPFLLFLLGALLTCTLEYLTSYIMEKMFNARWWDYSDLKFNINGRVSLLGAVAFGIFSALLIKIIHPFVSQCTDMIPIWIFHIAVILILLIFITDNIITFIGFSSFNNKLKDISAAFAKQKEGAIEKIKGTAIYSSVNNVHAAIINRLTSQQKRMIEAFPKLKSLKYNDTLTQIRNYMRDKKKKK